MKIRNKFLFILSICNIFYWYFTIIIWSKHERRPGDTEVDFQHVLLEGQSKQFLQQAENNFREEYQLLHPGSEQYECA